MATSPPGSNGAARPYPEAGSGSMFPLASRDEQL